VNADKLTDEQRRARAITLDEAARKIKAEYGDALAVLGFLPVVQRVWSYTVAEHVDNALSRGIELNPRAQELQREWIDLLNGATPSELALLTAVLDKLLSIDHLGMRHRGLLDEVIFVLTHAETRLETRRKRGEVE
jgi:hypothetical protein